MITSNTLNFGWNSKDVYALLFKLLLVFLIATTVVASCDNDNDYDDHDRIASHAERTLR